MIGAIVLLSAVTIERLGELWLARRNTRRLMEAGAREVAAGHYPFIVLLHATWLAGLWLFASNRPVSSFWFAVFALLQILRFWTLRTLGRRWTTRILVVPGEKLVTDGPYRYIRHPNYAVVIGEIAVLPLCFGMPIFALAFSVANAIMLAIRITAENAALEGTRRGGQV